jgi:predicted RNase H-like nuclease
VLGLQAADHVSAPAVLGVDGCAAGWVGALLVDGQVSLSVAPGIEALVAALPVVPAVVGVDIPIGLPDSGGREADRLARAELPVGRKSSVFPTPVRAAVLADTWPEANAANRAASGKGLSHQGFNLCRKIAEVDAWVLAGPPVAVAEVHPEVSFAVMGADTRPSKKRPEGREVRLGALLDVAMVLPATLRGPGWAVDDALDACAAAWTAGRIATGRALSLPDPPEVFSDGIEAAIRA